MQAFGFHPHSYILPNEYTRFVSEYAKESQKHGRKVSVHIYVFTNIVWNIMSSCRFSTKGFSAMENNTLDHVFPICLPVHAAASSR